MVAIFSRIIFYRTGASLSKMLTPTWNCVKISTEKIHSKAYFNNEILTAGVWPVLSNLNPFNASDDKFFLISCALE